MRCPNCGFDMVVAIRDANNILYECNYCEETSIEHVYSPEEEELNKFRERVTSLEDDLRIPNDFRLEPKENEDE